MYGELALGVTGRSNPATLPRTPFELSLIARRTPRVVTRAAVGWITSGYPTTEQARAAPELVPGRVCQRRLRRGYTWFLGQQPWLARYSKVVYFWNRALAEVVSARYSDSERRTPGNTKLVSG